MQNNYDNDNQLRGLRDNTARIQERINNVMAQYGLPPPLVRQYGVNEDFTRDEWVNYYRLTNIALTDALNNMLLQVQQAE
jgi:hypothetical protein